MFHTSLRVKKLSRVLTLLAEVQDGMFRDIIDVDTLVSKFKVRADNSVCFVLGHHSLAENSFFQFNLHNSSYNIELVLVDQNIFTWRTINIHKLRMQGDRLLIDENYRSYNLDLRQDVFVEKDPTKNCTVYPNSEYESYDKCDQAYVQAMFPGIAPIWNTDDISKATRNSSIIEEKKDKYTLLAEGLDVSPCKLPCTSTKVTAQLAMVANDNQPGSRVAEKYSPHLISLNLGFNSGTDPNLGTCLIYQKTTAKAKNN